MDYATRKHIRLKEYDYSQEGAYHINIHTLPGAPPISSIVNCDKPIDSAVYPRMNLIYPGDVETKLTDFGEICYNILEEMKEKYSSFEIVTFAFMPTHIHLLLRIKTSTGLSITDYVRELKSKTTIQYNRKKNTTGRKLFQSSFYEHIIRAESDYILTIEYIDNNPFRGRHY